jgi:hypothetical protein
MALAQTHQIDLGFDNSGNWTPAAFNTTGDTWCVLLLEAFSANVANITAITYNGTDITPLKHANGATAHNSANRIVSVPFALGADAGNHTFNVVWTGGGFFVGVATSGTGAVHASVIDATSYVDSESDTTGGVGTLTPYTLSDSNSLPIFALWSPAAAALTANANCTKDVINTTGGQALFHGPIASPTSAKVNDPSTEFLLATTFAIRPAAGGSVGTVTGQATVAGVGASTAASVGTVNGAATVVGVPAGPQVNISAGATVVGVATPTSGALTLDNSKTKFEGGTILVYQRALSNSTNVALTGTYSGGTPTHIEWSWKGGAFTTISTESISAGVWSGTLPTLAGDEGTLILRWSNDHTVTVTTWLALGDYALVLGDSLAAGQNISGQAASATPKKTRYNHSSVTHEWVEEDSTTDVGPWGLLGTQITSQQSVPFGHLNVGASGSALHHWRHGQTDFDAAMTAFTDYGLNAVRYVLIHLGTNDAINDSTDTPTSIRTQMEATVADLNSFLPGGPATYVWAPIAEIPSSVGVLRTERDAVTQGLLDAVSLGDFTIGANLCELSFSDSTHPDNIHAAADAQRWFFAVSDASYGTTFGRGPRVLTAGLDATKKIITIGYDRDLGNTISTSVGGFLVTDGGTPVTISTSVVTAIRTVTLTLPVAIVGVCQVSFSSGNDAVGQTVPTSTAMSLPAGGTATIPAEPFINRTTDTIATSVGTVVAGATAAAVGTHTTLLSAGSGTFTITGSTVTFKQTHAMVAGSGSFSFTGTSATLKVKAATHPRNIDGLQASDTTTQSLLANV